MLINRFLLLAIALLLINNPSNAMLRPTTLCKLNSIATLHARYINSATHQSTPINRHCPLRKIGTAAAASVIVYTFYQEKQKQKLELEQELRQEEELMRLHYLYDNYEEKPKRLQNTILAKNKNIQE